MNREFLKSTTLLKETWLLESDIKDGVKNWMNKIISCFSVSQALKDENKYIILKRNSGINEAEVSRTLVLRMKSPDFS